MPIPVAAGCRGMRGGCSHGWLRLCPGVAVSRTFAYEYALTKNEVQVGDTEWVAITTNLDADPRFVSLSGLGDGQYFMKLRAIDLAGNISPSLTYVLMCGCVRLQPATRWL